MRNFIGLLVLMYGLALSPWAGAAVNNSDLVWQWANPLPQGNDLNDVVWAEELKLWVAVGDAGTVITSLDGGAWALQHSGVDEALHSIAWNGEQFVAVGAHGTILTSPDGVSWHLQHSSTSHYLNAITWGGNQFVAVGDNGTILTSLNGITWLQRESGNKYQRFNAITWNGSRFVVVGGLLFYYHAIILTSSDGVIWSQQNVGDIPLYDITFGMAVSSLLLVDMMRPVLIVVSS